MSAVVVSEPTTKAEYYSILTTKEREISQSLGQTFFDSSRKSVEAIKEAGDALITAKKKLKGKFMYFCKYELPVDCSQDTIEGFMRLATIINERPQLIKYNPTILFELSRRSTPPEIVEEMTALAEKNQHQEVKVKEVKSKIAEAKKSVVTIKKGDIVEWQMSVKGYIFGRVRSKTTDGLACRIESLDGKNLGGKATKQLTLCPVQKQHEGIPDTQALVLNLGQKVIVLPYSSDTQSYAGRIGTVMVRYPQRRTFTIDMGDKVREFFWEELKLLKEEPTPPTEEVEPTDVDDDKDSEDFIDVEAQVVKEPLSLPEAQPIFEVENLSWSEKRQLLKELLNEMRGGASLPKDDIDIQLDNLVEKTLTELDEITGGSQNQRAQFALALVDKCFS